MNYEMTNSFTEALFDIWKEVGNESTLQVSGWSMYPLIEDGDRVVVKHSHNNIKPGATIAFKKDHRIIVHRVLRCYNVRGETIYVNRGDNNLHIDSRVGDCAILGKVVGIVKKDGTKVNLESPLWQAVGYFVVKFTNISRFLPKRITQIRFAKIVDWFALTLRPST